MDIIKQGIKTFKGDAVWYNWRLYRVHDVEDVREFMEENSGGGHCGDPGAYFEGSPCFRLGRGKLLVTQRCGYDV
jgi:hypothetical protein